MTIFSFINIHFLTLNTAPPVGHPIITRSKAGILKPKSYLADILAKPSEPTSITEAISDKK